MTHAESPWQRADANRPPKGSAPIRREWILEYFRAEQESDDEAPLPEPEISRRFVEGAEQRQQQPVGSDSAEGIRARLPRRG
jgi:hypothetical protein